MNLKATRDKPTKKFAEPIIQETDESLAVADADCTFTPEAGDRVTFGSVTGVVIQVATDYVNDQAAMRITTGTLNSVLADAQTRVQPPTDKGRRLKIYYMTQVGVKPPHFVIFCNDKKLFHFSYQRYLENQLRSVFGLEGTPIVLTIRQKGEDDG